MSQAPSSYDPHIEGYIDMYKVLVDVSEHRVAQHTSHCFTLLSPEK